MNRELSSKYSRHALMVFLLIVANPSFSADWSDTFAGFRVGTKFTEPGVSNNIRKDIYSVTHVSEYKYGTNYFTSDFLLSDANDPAMNGGGGAQEIYAVYRHTLSFAKTLDRNIGGSLVKDVGLTVGADLNSKNDNMGPGVRRQVVGPTLIMNVPGYMGISLFYRGETTHNGMVGRDVRFRNTGGVTVVWNIPMFGAHAKSDGVINYIGKKGKDGFGNETEAETLARFDILLDIGRGGGASGAFYAGIGYEYWHHKYGLSSAIVRDTKTPMFEMEAHF